MEEWHAGLTRDCAGQHRLAAAGRSEQQPALGDLGAESLEFLGVLKELDDLLKLLLRLLHAGNVLEGDLGYVVRQSLGAGASERERLIAAGLGLSNEDDPEDG